MPRLFVAIDLPEERRRSLASLRDDELSVRWPRLDQYHLTLRFIGDVDVSVRHVIEERLAEIQAQAFTAEAYRGIGAFPSRRKPRVLIVRLQAPPPLLKLQQSVEAEVQAAGLEPDDRSFTPHVTIGRVKRARRQDVRTFMQRHQEFVLEPFDVDAFHLYESTLHPEGARYEKLATFDLQHE